MSASEFERTLGFLDATAIGLGTMIGGGIFILPSIAAAQAGPASVVSFIGFAVIATAAAEIEDPARNLPLSMITAVLVPTVLYVGVMVVSTGVLPADELHGSRVPVAAVAAQFAGELGALAMVGGALLATVSSANASILAASRVGFAMGGHALLPDWFNHVSDRLGTPYRTILATGVGIVALAGLQVGIDVLAEVASFLYLVTYGLVHVAVVRLRRSDDAYDPEFRMPSVLYPAVPVVGVLATLGIMTQMQPIVTAGGAAVAVAALVWYLVFGRRRG